MTEKDKDDQKALKDVEDRIAVIEGALINAGHLVRGPKGRCVFPHELPEAKPAKE